MCSTAPEVLAKGEAGLRFNIGSVFRQTCSCPPHETFPLVATQANR
jgi:hypothetical protein